MSIVPMLLLVLLISSFHACNATSRGVLHNDAAPEFHSSISKGNDKLNPARVSTQPERKESTPNGIGKQESNRLEEEKAKGDRVKASVSWRVPRNKGGDREPGFNLDYLPPKRTLPSTTEPALFLQPPWATYRVWTISEESSTM